MGRSRGGMNILEMDSPAIDLPGKCGFFEMVSWCRKRSDHYQLYD